MSLPEPGPALPWMSLACWLRALVRLALMLGLLLALMPLVLGLRACGRVIEPWPRRFLAALARIAGIRLTLVGVRAPGRVLLLGNHVSWIDIPVVCAATGTAFVAHDGIAAVPVLRFLAGLNDTVFIARHRRHTVGEQVNAVRAALADCGALTVFPEGTTGDGTALLPFKSSLLGALDPLPEGLCVQPFWLDFGPEAAGIAWVGTEHGLHNFLRILGRARPVGVTLHFLEPLCGEALGGRKAMAAAARHAIAGAMRGRI